MHLMIYYKLELWMKLNLMKVLYLWMNVGSEDFPDVQWKTDIAKVTSDIL